MGTTFNVDDFDIDEELFGDGMCLLYGCHEDAQLVYVLVVSKAYDDDCCLNIVKTCSNLYDIIKCLLNIHEISNPIHHPNQFELDDQAWNKARSEIWNFIVQICLQFQPWQ